MVVILKGAKGLGKMKKQGVKTEIFCVQCDWLIYGGVSMGHTSCIRTFMVPGVFIVDNKSPPTPSAPRNTAMSKR